MVLSLSPGPAKIEQAWHYEKYANMWRITDDFWDTWPLLLDMFKRCELWQNHVSEGCYPDCDMIPVGYVGKGFHQERETGFTRDEQITMMTLWCIFRSPLMLGAELTKLDDWTKELLTNQKVLRLLSASKGAKQILRDNKKAVWVSEDTEENAWYLALFNFKETESTICIDEAELKDFRLSGKEYEELWTKEVGVNEGRELKAQIASHGAKLFKIAK